MSREFIRTCKWIVFLFIALLYAYRIFFSVDPDLGWHLRTGEQVLLTHHAPHINVWSYYLPGHTWIDHEWAVDTLLWLGWSHHAWVLVELLFLLIVLIPLGYWIKRSLNALDLFFATVAGTYMINFVGVRPQMWSYLLFFFFYLLLEKHSSLFKKPWFLAIIPLYFLMWANIHGGFPAGLLAWGILLAVRGYNEVFVGKDSKLRSLVPEGISLIVSCVATLSTPYGLDLIKEIYFTTHFQTLGRIAEWQPALYHWSFPFLFLIGIMIPLFHITTSKKEVGLLAPTIAFFLLFMQHVRMVPMFFVTVLPALRNSTEQFFAHTISGSSEERIKITFRLEVAALVGVLLTLCFAPSTSHLSSIFTPPEAAIAALDSAYLAHIPGRVFNDYGYGGWMIYVHPERQVYIDGRMAQWQTTSGTAAFDEYVDMTETPGKWRATFTQYGITKAILTRDSWTVIPVPTHISLGPFTNAIRQLLGAHDYESLPSQLLKAGWCMRYSDEQAIILVAPEYCHK